MLVENTAFLSIRDQKSEDNIVGIYQSNRIFFIA